MTFINVVSNVIHNVDRQGGLYMDQLQDLVQKPAVGAVGVHGPTGGLMYAGC